VNAQKFLGWQPGWDHGTYNTLWFWLANTGIFIPLLLLALAWRRPDFALSQRLLKFYAPFLLCFIVPNLIKLAHGSGTILKFFSFGTLPPCRWWRLLLARLWQRKSFYRWLAATALAAMVLAGTLDIFRVLTNTTEYQEFDIHAMAMADVISQRVAPRAVVLHAPTYNSPVF